MISLRPKKAPANYVTEPEAPPEPVAELILEEQRQRLQEAVERELRAVEGARERAARLRAEIAEVDDQLRRQAVAEDLRHQADDLVPALVDACHDMALLLAEEDRVVRRLAPLSARLDALGPEREGLRANIELAAANPGAISGLVRWQARLTAMEAVEPELRAKVEPLAVKLAEVRDQIVRRGMTVDQVERAMDDLRWRADHDPDGDGQFVKPVDPQAEQLKRWQASPSGQLAATNWRLANQAADNRLRRAGVLPLR